MAGTGHKGNHTDRPVTNPGGGEPGEVPTPARTPRADDSALVHIRDLAGRPRGVGFLADHDGTLLTSHEAVDGLARLVLHGAGDRTCVVGPDAVTALPERNLALVRTEGLGVDPLPLTQHERVDAGTYVRIPAGCWREARVLAATEVTYTSTDGFHLVEDALELAIGTAGRDALRLGGGAAGGPVLDACTGAVLGVLGTALHTAQRDAGFAVPLRPADGPLAELLARNAATVPAYGTDLNPAGILELTVTSVAQDGPPGALSGAGEAIERTAVVRELAAFAEGERAVLGLVGAPGSGRTTELAALAARRTRGERPAPTLWLRGADLHDTDDSVADAARRTLERAARIVAAARSVHPGDLGDVTPEHLAHLAARAGRPLLLLLDGPEEMPPVLAHRLPEWTRGTADWLRRTGARLVVACREEYWERAATCFPPDLLHTPQDPAPTAPESPCPPARPPHTALPSCLRVGDFTPEEARRARARYGIPDGVLAYRDARHPLTLRLLAEVRAALPDAPYAGPVDRHEVFAAHLDLMCLRIAVRLAAASGLRGTAVRRLAARVAGQVHEAARRSLGPGQGELDRESFEAVFPWGPAPARLGGGTGWASAVLTEGLLVPAGGGYRFADEELADWIQGMHLDLDEALYALVHRPRTAREAHPVPVPHHRVGPVVQALLLLARQHGTRRLGFCLRELIDSLDLSLPAAQDLSWDPSAPPAPPRDRDNGSWWAARLLARTLLQVPDAAPYTEVLRLLADRVVAWRGERRPVPGEFGPAFWTALPLPAAARLDLLRRLVLADPPPPPPPSASPPPPDPGAERRSGADERPPDARYLDAVARLLAAAPGAVQPELTRWFEDERLLPATPHATVATAAQALLHTHRHGALDELVDALVASGHRRADELLTVLAEEEPGAVCRAVGRWARDERPARRAAAVAHGPRVAPHARSAADRELLRHAALALLARPDDSGLHAGALALLVHDPHTREAHLPEALRHFADGDPHLPPSALFPALSTHPEPVLEAFRARLRGPDAEASLTTLGALVAEVATPAVARRAASLVQEAVRRRPETAGRVAARVDRRLTEGPTARPVLLPLVTGLLDDGPEPLRAALATVLAAPGTPASRPLRRELLEALLARERDPSVLVAVLHAAAEHRGGPETEAEARGLVHRTGLLLVRTPEGATRFDRSLVDLGRHVPGFAALVTRWLTDTPDDWAAVVGPSARRMLENLAGVRVPA
ncbi:trypsin-like peptidase domain-containing protein [Streptomyces sp. NPDC127190]|uniref:trypsin-like peptidase domain-containing protein n=1 Tax=Streptomyces sp. NPDC127190 TaxID=3345387 RepID=UPI003630EEC6